MVYVAQTSGVIPGMQGLFNIQKIHQCNTTYQENKGQKLHDNLNRYRSIWQNSVIFDKKHSIK